MPDKEHGEECQSGKDRSIREQRRHTELVHKITGKDRCNDLCCHGSRIIIPGVLSNIASGAQFYDHGEGVDIDRRPRDSSKGKDAVHNQCRTVSPHEDAGGERCCQHDDTGDNRLLPADFGGNNANGQVGDDGCGLGNDQREVIVLVENVAGVNGILGSNGIVSHEP